MAVNFTPPEQAERIWGRPPEPVPDEIGQLLDKTYRDGRMAEMVCPEADQPEWIRLCRLYAKRQDKTIYCYAFERDGKEWIAFRMKDKRIYKPRKKKAQP